MYVIVKKNTYFKFLMQKTKIKTCLTILRVNFCQLSEQHRKLITNELINRIVMFTKSVMRAIVHLLAKSKYWQT